MNSYYKLPDGLEIDPAVNEAIIRNARGLPMEVIYTDDNGKMAHGNSVQGYRFFDSDGNPVSREEAEPFKITGTNFVIKQGLLIIEALEI